MNPEPNQIIQRSLTATRLTPFAYPAPSNRPATAGTLGKIVSTARHYSQLVYAVPSARMRTLFPTALKDQQFEVAETSMAGQAYCWLTVTSYLDQKTPLPGITEEGLELTEYRLHVQRDGQPYQWLFNTSVGSLGAVGARHLWTLPWHLSAMEFWLSYQEEALRYQTYRVRMQSEHLSALWDLRDTGEPLADFNTRAVPGFVTNPVVQDCFLRRDGSVGTRQTRFRLTLSTRGELLQGRCDWLTRQGWLTSTELSQPRFVQLCRSVAFEQEIPRILAPQDDLFPRSLRQAA